MSVRHAGRRSSRRQSEPRHSGTLSKSKIGWLLPFVFITALFVLPPSPISAYKVCTDDRAPCFHENMAQDAMALFNGGGIASHLAQLRAGAGGEDNVDHVFGYEKAFPYSDSFVTAPHFWDVDAGPNDPVKFVDGYTAPLEWAFIGGGSYPNAYHKAQALWNQIGRAHV